MKKFLTFLVAGFAVLILSWVVLIGAVYAWGGVMTVHVEDRNEGFNLYLPVPVAVVDAAVATGGLVLPREELLDIDVDLGEWEPMVRGLVEALDDCPDVTLDIVGRRPGIKIRQLADKDSTIQVFADVPDVRPHVAASDLFIVPLRIGGGSRIKIYEAMAMRRPVVSTTIGAEGLPLTPGRDVAIGDSPAEFAAQVVRLLKNRGLKSSIASSGFRLVTENYQWTNVALKLRDRCLELTKSR